MDSILIVDDESPMREILVRWLKPAGYLIAEAANAEVALEILASTAVDVLVSDIQMPGHDGLWLLARVRERFPQVAIVLATADDRVAPSTTLQPAVVDYLVKPFSREPVLAAVSRGVKWRRAAIDSGPEADRGDVLEKWLKPSVK
jgi:two-component system nitrogen regulation response regulator GlnG